MAKRSRRGTSLPIGVERDLVATPDRHDPVGLDVWSARLLAMLDGGARPVLVGPSEVGKTAIVHALAAEIREGVSPQYGGVWSVSLRGLDLTSAKDPGVPTQLRRIVVAAEAMRPNPILFFSDLRYLRFYDLGFALGELLRRHSVPTIGEAGPAFLAWLAEDAELARTFVPVRVDEPPPQEATRRIERIAARAGYALSPTAASTAVALSRRLEPHRQLPGAALTFVHSAASLARSESSASVTDRHVADAASTALRVPRTLLEPGPALDMNAFREALRDAADGLQGATDAVLDAVVGFRTGAHDPTHPLGVYLLAGPAGSGKTTFVRDVARLLLGDVARLLHVPLAEHAEEWKAEQLFGQRTAQHVEGRQGLLSRALSGHGFSVVLFDEIEKAHPLVVRHLYRALDTGMFVDGNDELVYLRNALVFVTAALPADFVDVRSFGFSPQGASKDGAVDSVRRRLAPMLTPELIDRFDGVFVCGAPDEAALAIRARSILDALGRRAGLAERGITLAADEDVGVWLSRRARAAPAGASVLRALRRTIDRTIVAPLALKIDAGEVPSGAVVRVHVREGVIVFDVPVRAMPVREGGRPPGSERATAVVALRRGANRKV